MMEGGQGPGGKDRDHVQGRSKPRLSGMRVLSVKGSQAIFKVCWKPMPWSWQELLTPFAPIVGPRIATCSCSCAAHAVQLKRYGASLPEKAR